MQAIIMEVYTARKKMIIIEALEDPVMLTGVDGVWRTQ